MTINVLKLVHCITLYKCLFNFDTFKINQNEIAQILNRISLSFCDLNCKQGSVPVPLTLNLCVKYTKSLPSSSTPISPFLSKSPLHFLEFCIFHLISFIKIKYHFLPFLLASVSSSLLIVICRKTDANNRRLSSSSAKLLISSVGTCFLNKLLLFSTPITKSLGKLFLFLNFESLFLCLKAVAMFSNKLYRKCMINLNQLHEMTFVYIFVTFHFVQV